MKKILKIVMMSVFALTLASSCSMEDIFDNVSFEILSFDSGMLDSLSDLSLDSDTEDASVTEDPTTEISTETVISYDTYEEAPSVYDFSGGFDVTDASFRKGKGNLTKSNSVELFNTIVSYFVDPDGTCDYDYTEIDDIYLNKGVMDDFNDAGISFQKMTQVKTAFTTYGKLFFYEENMTKEGITGTLNLCKRLSVILDENAFAAIAVSIPKLLNLADCEGNYYLANGEYDKKFYDRVLEVTEDETVKSYYQEYLDNNQSFENELEEANDLSTRFDVYEDVLSLAGKDVYHLVKNVFSSFTMDELTVTADRIARLSGFTVDDVSEATRSDVFGLIKDAGKFLDEDFLSAQSIYALGTLAKAAYPFFDSYARREAMAYLTTRCFYNDMDEKFFDPLLSSYEDIYRVIRFAGSLCDEIESDEFDSIYDSVKNACDGMDYDEFRDELAGAVMTGSSIIKRVFNKYSEDDYNALIGSIRQCLSLVDDAVNYFNCLILGSDLYQHDYHFDFDLDTWLAKIDEWADAEKNDAAIQNDVFTYFRDNLLDNAAVFYEGNNTSSCGLTTTGTLYEGRYVAVGEEFPYAAYQSNDYGYMDQTSDLEVKGYDSSYVHNGVAEVIVNDVTFYIGYGVRDNLTETGSSVNLWQMNYYSQSSLEENLNQEIGYIDNNGEYSYWYEKYLRLGDCASVSTEPGWHVADYVYNNTHYPVAYGVYNDSECSKRVVNSIALIQGVDYSEQEITVYVQDYGKMDDFYGNEDVYSWGSGNYKKVTLPFAALGVDTSDSMDETEIEFDYEGSHYYASVYVQAAHKLKTGTTGYESGYYYFNATSDGYYLFEGENYDLLSSDLLTDDMELQQSYVDNVHYITCQLTKGQQLLFNANSENPKLKVTKGTILTNVNAKPTVKVINLPYYEPGDDVSVREAIPVQVYFSNKITRTFYDYVDGTVAGSDITVDPDYEWDYSMYYIHGSYDNVSFDLWVTRAFYYDQSIFREKGTTLDSVNYVYHNQWKSFSLETPVDTDTLGKSVLNLTIEDHDATYYVLVYDESMYQKDYWVGNTGYSVYVGDTYTITEADIYGNIYVQGEKTSYTVDNYYNSVTLEEPYEYTATEKGYHFTDSMTVYDEAIDRTLTYNYYFEVFENTELVLNEETKGNYYNYAYATLDFPGMIYLVTVQGDHTEYVDLWTEGNARVYSEYTYDDERTWVVLCTGENAGVTMKEWASWGYDDDLTFRYEYAPIGDILNYSFAPNEEDTTVHVEIILTTTINGETVTGRLSFDVQEADIEEIDIQANYIKFTYRGLHFELK